MKAVSGADGIRLTTSVDESVSFFKQGFAGTGGVAKSARKSGKDSNKIFWGKWEDINMYLLDYGRCISPNYIEDIINTGKVSSQVVDNVTRIVFSSGTVDVITEQNG